MEIGIPRADLLDAVLAHENGGMRIVEDIAREMREFRNDFTGDVRVALRWDKHADPR